MVRLNSSTWTATSEIRSRARQTTSATRRRGQRELGPITCLRGMFLAPDREFYPVGRPRNIPYLAAATIGGLSCPHSLGLFIRLRVVLLLRSTVEVFTTTNRRPTAHGQANLAAPDLAVGEEHPGSRATFPCQPPAAWDHLKMADSTGQRKKLSELSSSLHVPKIRLFRPKIRDRRIRRRPRPRPWCRRRGADRQ